MKPRPNDLSTAEVRRILELYETMSGPEVAAKVGRCVATVLRHVRLAGKGRSRSEACRFHHSQRKAAKRARMVEMYRTSPAPAVAKALGCSESTVLRAVRAAGVAVRTKRQAETLRRGKRTVGNVRRLLELVGRGWSVNKARKVVGISWPTAQRWIAQAHREVSRTDAINAP